MKNENRKLVLEQSDIKEVDISVFNDVIDIESIIPALSADELKNIEDDIRSNGVLTPLVLSINENNKYTLVDGYTRFRIVSQLTIDKAEGFDGDVKIPVDIYKSVSDDADIANRLRFNIQRRQLSRADYSELVAKLRRLEGLSIRKAAEKYDLPKSTIQDAEKRLKVKEETAERIEEVKEELVKEKLGDAFSTFFDDDDDDKLIVEAEKIVKEEKKALSDAEKLARRKKNAARDLKRIGNILKEGEINLDFIKEALNISDSQTKEIVMSDFEYKVKNTPARTSRDITGYLSFKRTRRALYHPFTKLCLEQPSFPNMFPWLEPKGLYKHEALPTIQTRDVVYTKSSLMLNNAGFLILAAWPLANERFQAPSTIENWTGLV